MVTFEKDASKRHPRSIKLLRFCYSPFRKGELLLSLFILPEYVSVSLLTILGKNVKIKIIGIYEITYMHPVWHKKGDRGEGAWVWLF